MMKTIHQPKINRIPATDENAALSPLQYEKANKRALTDTLQQEF